MQSMKMNDRQSKELADEIGKILAEQLDSDTIRNKVNRLVSDYLKQNKLDSDPKEIANNMTWSVKVQLNR